MGKESVLKESSQPCVGGNARTEFAYLRSVSLLATELRLHKLFIAHSIFFVTALASLPGRPRNTTALKKEIGPLHRQEKGPTQPSRNTTSLKKEIGLGSHYSFRLQTSLLRRVKRLPAPPFSALINQRLKIGYLAKNHSQRPCDVLNQPVVRPALWCVKSNGV